MSIKMHSLTEQINESDILSILRQMIRIRTLLPRGDELDMIKFILSLFPENTLEVKVIEHGANRASLVATLPGHSNKNKITMVGHMDTFPIIGEDKWQHPPFAADYENGRVYGRGATNMKGGIAAMVSAMLMFTKNSILPPCDLVLCLTADGDNAALTGARSVAGSGYLKGTTRLIFGEPTENKIGIAQRGGIWFKIRVFGEASYACIPNVGTDALASFIDFYSQVKKYVCDDKLPHVYLGEPLCSITQLHGGIATNVLSPYAEGTIDIRLLPLQDNDEVIQFANKTAKQMMENNKSLKMEIEILSSNSTVAMPTDAHIIKRFEEIVASMGDKPEKTGLNYYTDACAIVPSLGVPFVFYGPGEDIYNIPSDESVPLKSVIKATQVYIEYILGENW